MIWKKCVEWSTSLSKICSKLMQSCKYVHNMSHIAFHSTQYSFVHCSDGKGPGIQCLSLIVIGLTPMLAWFASRTTTHTHTHTNTHTHTRTHTHTHTVWHMYMCVCECVCVCNDIYKETLTVFDHILFSFFTFDGRQLMTKSATLVAQKSQTIHHPRWKFWRDIVMRLLGKQQD